MSRVDAAVMVLAFWSIVFIIVVLVTEFLERYFYEHD